MNSTAFDSLDADLQAKITRCRGILLRLRRVVVAFSGGVDSTFLLALASETLGKENVVAVMGVSAIHSAREQQAAREMAEQLGVEMVEITTEEMSNPQFLANPPQRCYICKRHVMVPMIELAGRRGFGAVLSGTNADDLGDFRPGIQAAKELGIVNPLLDANFTKEDIRSASRAMELPTWDKPSMACLASRIPYGQDVTVEKLRRIESAENLLHDLGFSNCRLRDHHPIARIEVPPEQFEMAMAHRNRLVAHLKELGYTFVTLDLEGFRSGSLNPLTKVAGSQ